MKIEIHRTDIEKIAKDESHSEMERAIASKCLELYGTLDKVNEQKNAYFETLYSVCCRIERSAAGQYLRKKLKNDLQAQSAADLKRSIKLGALAQNLSESVAQ